MPVLSFKFWFFLSAAPFLLLLSCSYFTKSRGPAPLILTSQKSLEAVIRDLPFFPINGERFRLSELKDLRAVVVAIRSKAPGACASESKRAGLLLSRLEKNYTPQGVKFIYSYYSPRGFDLSDEEKRQAVQEAEEDLRHFAFQGDYIVDSKQKLLLELDARSAGEVFVLDRQRRLLLYKGFLPSQELEGRDLEELQRSKELEKSGRTRQEVKASSLKAKEKKLPLELVLDSLIKGENVTQPTTRGSSFLTQSPTKLCPIPRPHINRKVFFEEVAPIIHNRCTVCHHPEGTGPMDFISYQDVAGRAKMFQYVIEQDLMPPWSVDPNTGPFKNDLSLTVRERALLLKWVYGESRRGHREDQVGRESETETGNKTGTGFLRRDQSKDQLQELYLKQQREKAKEEVDWVLRLPEPVKIPKGFKPQMFSDYKNFIIKTNFKEDKWIKQINFIHKPKVIHHTNLIVMRPGLSQEYLTSILHDSDEMYKNTINFFGSPDHSWYVKLFHSDFPSAGALIPKGSAFLLFIHYEYPDQNIVDDTTHVEFVFHSKPPKYKLITLVLNSIKIDLSPFDPHYKSQLKYKLRDNMWFVNFLPHMHLRGKASSIYIHEPENQTKDQTRDQTEDQTERKTGKRRKKLFSTDPYLTRFDTIIELQKPLFIKKGTIFECVNYFDNSANNPENPDPSKFVSFGPARTDEMSQCYLNFLVPVDSKLKTQYINL